MNSDDPKTPPPDLASDRSPADADEARVLAMLLGEASPYESEAVDELLARRPDLRAYRDRTVVLLGLVTGALKPGADLESPALRLDDSRRAALLEKLREPAAAKTTISFPKSEEKKGGRIIPFLRAVTAMSRNWGMQTAVVILLFGVLALVANNYVVSKYTPPRRAEVTVTFATGAGGGAAGEKAKAFEHKMQSLTESEGSPGSYAGAFTPTKSPSRIISKSADASVSLPQSAVGSGGEAAVETRIQAARAKSLYGDNLGALESYKDALQYDPQNAEAKRASIILRQRLHDDAGRSGSDATKSKLLDEVDMKWATSESFNRDAASDAQPAPARAAITPVVVASKFIEIAEPAEPPSFASGLTAGGMSAGSGGGSGGGEGTGIGIGKGGGKNFVSAFGARSPGNRDDAAAGAGDELVADQSAPMPILSGATGNRTLDSAYRPAPAPAPASPSAVIHDKVPALGDMPLMGKLFQSNGKSEVRANLAGAAGDNGGALYREPLDRVAAIDAEKKSLLAKDAESDDAPLASPAKKPAAPVPAQTETLAADNAFSTFSLNVSDVSFRLAGEAVKRGAYPDSANIRTEEFINAQTYRDPMPRAGEAVALRQEQATHPFAHNRTLLRLSLKTGAEGRAAQSPLSLVVLLDDSGSMERSDRRETVAAANGILADNLRPGDRVSVIGFARDTRLLIDRMDGADTRPLRDLAKNGVPAEGGTNLENALNTAYSQLARQTPAGATGRVLLLTDGAANLGDADPARLATIVEANRRQGRALDAFGVGFDGYNDTMLETLSRKGDGRYAYLNNADEARDELGRKLAGALRPFANDVKVQVEFYPGRVNAWRLLGYDNHRLNKQDFRNNKVDAAELAAAESGTALYAMELKPDGAGDLGVVRVRYRVPGTQDYREREWPIPYTGAPAFADAPEGVRLAACSAFVAEAFANNPNAAGLDRTELRKQIARLAAARPGDPALATLRALSERLAADR